MLRINVGVVFLPNHKRVFSFGRASQAVGELTVNRPRVQITQIKPESYTDMFHLSCHNRENYLQNEAQSKDPNGNMLFERPASNSEYHHILNNSGKPVCMQS